MFLKILQILHENTCAIKKETLAQVFSFDFCEIFKNTFFTEHLRTTASIERGRLIKGGALFWPEYETV